MLARLTLIITALSSAAIVVAITIGGRITTPLGEDFFAANSCAFPCIYGIELGKSERGAILAALEPITPSILSPGDAPIIFTSYQGEQRYVDGAFWFERSNAPTKSVQFAQFYANTATQLWTLSDILLAGHRPTAVYRTCRGARQQRLLISFDADHAFVVGVIAADNRLTPDASITLLYLSTGENMLLFARQAFFGGCYIESNWRGFVPTRRYFNPYRR